MKATNLQRLRRAESGLRRAQRKGDEYEIAWWQERVDFCRMAVMRDGPDARTPFTAAWRGQLESWRKGGEP